MFFNLRFDKDAKQQLQELESNPSLKRILKDVRKALGFMQINLKHPSLNPHEFHGFKGANSEKSF